MGVEVVKILFLRHYGRNTVIGRERFDSLELRHRCFSQCRRAASVGPLISPMLVRLDPAQTSTLAGASECVQAQPAKVCGQCGTARSEQPKAWFALLSST